MIFILPYFIAFALGSFLFGAIYPRNTWKGPMSLLVIWWLGIAASAVVVMFSIGLNGEYAPNHLIAMTILTFISCMMLCRMRRGTPFFYLSHVNGHFLKLSLVLFFVWLISNGLSQHNLYGDWDAWSFWNYRARYLVAAQTHWKEIFLFNDQAKHPWLLPYWTVFGWTWIGGESYYFTFFNAQMFTLVLMATVFFSVVYLTRSDRAALYATIWLISIPYFIIHSMSQYAEVLTAGLIVLNIVWLARVLETYCVKDGLILGLMLGVMAFSKDEGMLSALLIVVLVLYFLRHDKRVRTWVLSGLAVASIPVVWVKFWMLAAPSGVNRMSVAHVFEAKRWYMVSNYFLHTWLKSYHGGGYLCLLGILVSYFVLPLNIKDRLMLWFLILYTAVFYFLYVTVDGHLYWRLLSTADRIVYLVMPLLIVFLFYRIFRPDAK